MNILQKTQSSSVQNSSDTTGQTQLSSVSTPASVTLPNLRETVEHELQKPEIRQQIDAFVGEAFEARTKQYANPTQHKHEQQRHGASESFSARSEKEIPQEAKKGRLESAKAQIAEKKTEALLEKVVAQAQPPLTETQAHALKKVMAGMPEKLQQGWLNHPNKEQVASTLLRLARGGQLERLIGKLDGNSNEKSLKLMAFGMMMAHPAKAKEIVDAALDIRTSHLGQNYSAGKQLQMGVLALAVEGHNTKEILADKAFFKMNFHAKAAMFSMISQGKATKEQMGEIYAKKEQIEKAIAGFEGKQSSRADKTAFLTKLAEHIQSDPRAFTLLSPQTKQALAGILVQRVGFGGGKGVDHDAAFRAMSALKSSDPAGYRQLFSPLVEAAQKGTESLKAHMAKALGNIAMNDAIAAGAGSLVQSIVSKCAAGFSEAGGAAGLGLGLVVGVALAASSADGGVNAVTSAATAFATGGLGAAIVATVSASGLAGIAIGTTVAAAPAALVALWSAFCERGVAEQQTKESAKQMMQNERIRP